jgi:hypothetical protein
MNVRWFIAPLLGVCGFILGYITPASPTSDTAPPHRLVTADAKVHAGPTASRASREARVELRGAFHSIGQIGSRAHRAHEFEKLMATLSLADLHYVAGLVRELPNHAMREALEAVILRLVTIDPTEALTALENGNLMPAAAAALMLGWSKTDPESATAWFNSYPGKEGWEKGRAVSVVSVLSQTDPERAVKLLLSAAADASPDTYGDFFGKWAAGNPAEAMERADKITNTAARRGAIEGVMRSWVAKDPGSALAWFNQVTDSKTRSEIAGGLAAGLYATDPQRSLEIIASLPEGRTRDRAAIALAQSLRQSGKAEEVTGLIAQIPFEPGNTDLIEFYRKRMPGNRLAFTSLLERLDNPALDPEERGAVEKFLTQDPSMHFAFSSTPDAAKALGELRDLPANDIRYNLLERAAAGWASWDAAKASAWVESLSGEARTRALSGVAQGWAQKAPDEAGAWIDQLPSNPVRDAAIVGYAKGAIASDPVATLARLRTIADPATRMRGLRESWQRWFQRGRDSAEKWRDTSQELTASERAELVSK